MLNVLASTYAIIIAVPNSKVMYFEQCHKNETTTRSKVDLVLIQYIVIWLFTIRNFLFSRTENKQNYIIYI